MEPFNRVAFQIVNGSGGGPDVKGCHGDLEDVHNVRRTIVRVDNRRYPLSGILSRIRCLITISAFWFLTSQAVNHLV